MSELVIQSYERLVKVAAIKITPCLTPVRVNKETKHFVLFLPQRQKS